jgi:hypothetical protein
MHLAPCSSKIRADAIKEPPKAGQQWGVQPQLTIREISEMANTDVTGIDKGRNKKELLEEWRDLQFVDQDANFIRYLGAFDKLGQMGLQKQRDEIVRECEEIKINEQRKLKQADQEAMCQRIAEILFDKFRTEGLFVGKSENLTVAA